MASLFHESAARNENITAFVNAAYFTNWGIYGRDFQPSEIPSQSLSHIFYAFLNVREDGTVYSGDTYADLEKHYEGDSWNEKGRNAYGCVKQLNILKKKNRNLKLLLSIGGWTWSSNFPVIASGDGTRKKFAKTAVDMMRDWGFDGIDIDWEYPQTAADTVNFVLLLKAVRAALDEYARVSQNYHFLLTITVGAASEHYRLLNLEELGGAVDYMTLMAYDYAGSWSTVSAHASNLYPDKNSVLCTPFNTDEAVKAYINGGIPSYKILLGMPIYGRSFQNTDGLGKPFVGVGAGSWEVGIWDYKVLPKSGSKVQCDNATKACWSYDAAKKELVSFDTPESVQAKVAYVKDNKLGGSVFWEASADKVGTGSVIETSLYTLGNIENSMNCLDYNDSVYDNIAGRHQQ